MYIDMKTKSLDKKSNTISYLLSKLSKFENSKTYFLKCSMTLPTICSMYSGGTQTIATTGKVYRLASHYRESATFESTAKAFLASGMCNVRMRFLIFWY